MRDTLWLQSGFSSREIVKSMVGAKSLGYQVKWGQNPDKDRCVPVGSVEFCESWLGYSPQPDFYPEFLSSHLHREVRRRIDLSQFCERGDWFIKSSERYKAWPARIWSTEEPPLDELVDASDVVEFVQEWRYYVADGCVLATGWYDGTDEDEPAPELQIDWPGGWCGAVDFGRLSNGKIALVESQLPYACGWYGEDHAAFVEWLFCGWEFVLKQSSQQLVCS